MQTLKDLRKQCNKTAAEVATALGITLQAISHYENGIRRINLEQVIVLSRLYDVSCEEIIQAQFNSCRKDQ